MSSILNIAVSGLNAAATRVANAASNIVNASSTGKISDSKRDYSAPGGATVTAQGTYNGYQPTDVISLSTYSSGGDPLNVTTQTVPRNPAYTAAYDPNSANANAEGIVGFPNVDLATEIVSDKQASVDYAASAKVIETTEKLQKSLLDIKT